MLKINSAKVVELKAFRQQQQKLAEQRPCSFSAVSDKGNKVYGIAAFLVVAKRNGGVDAFITSIANDSATTALNNAIKGGQQRKVGGSIAKMKADILSAFFYF